MFSHRHKLWSPIFFQSSTKYSVVIFRIGSSIISNIQLISSRRTVRIFAFKNSVGLQKLLSTRSKIVSSSLCKIMSKPQLCLLTEATCIRKTVKEIFIWYTKNRTFTKFFFFWTVYLQQNLPKVGKSLWKISSFVFNFKIS